MVEKEKVGMIMKPLLLRFGVAVVISLAGFLFSRLRTKSAPSASDCASDAGSQQKAQHEDDQASNDGIFIEKIVDSLTVGLSPRCEVVQSSEKDVEAPITEVNSSVSITSSEKHDHGEEIEHLRTMVGVLKERERNLEAQLLEFYGLKEQEMTITELQNRLKINNTEAKLLTLKIGSLQAENHSLKAQLADSAKAVVELNAAKSTIKVLRRKLRHEAEQNKEQISALQERVAKLQEHELSSAGPAGNGDNIEVNLQKLKIIQHEVDELKRANRRLQVENSELSQRLELTQVLDNSVLEDHEAQRLRETTGSLLRENENLTKQIEQLQEDRFVDAEELVYLRWINACLRYELRNYQPEAGKTAARDLSKALSPRSENKAKQLILDIGLDNMDFNSDNWSSPPASCITDSAERDRSSVDTSSVKKTSSSSKNKLLSSLRKLVRGKNSHVSFGKLDYMEQDDFASCRSSSVIDRITPSHSSSRYSFEIQRPRLMKAAELENVEKARSNSDLGSFYGHRRSTVDGIDAFGLTPGNLHDGEGSGQISDVVKFTRWRRRQYDCTYNKGQHNTS